jgi:MYXO-CTERM domain-containing protein
VPGALMLDNYRGTIYPSPDDSAALCAARGAAARDPECDVDLLSADAGCVGSKLDCRDVPTTPADGEPGSGSGSGCGCRVATAPHAPPAAHGLAAALLVLLAARRRRLVPRARRCAKGGPQLR